MKRIITAILAAILVAGAQTQDEAERLFKSAQNTEVVDGDLKTAIEQYDEIVTKFEKTNRSITASALVRMAGCYTKLGDAEAAKIYERIVRDYSDQPEAVALARARLGGADRNTHANGDRVVWSGEDIEHVGGSVSRDGRFISYTDWWSTGNLMLHDLASGTDRPLTGNKGWGGEGIALSSAFSRDGTEVAYGWMNYDPGRTEIRIVNIERTGIPEARRIFESEDVNRMDAIDWSPDGKWLAVHLVRKNSGGEISLVGEDGSQRVLRSVGWRGPKKIFFSPDSKYIAYDLPVSDEAVQRDVYVAAVDGSGEARAVAHAAHDFTMGWSPDGKQLLFASDRTGSVALWALPITNGKPMGAPTMLKPDIGSVSSLGMTASGALHLYKDTSTIALHIAPIDLEAGKLTGPAVVESYRSHRPDWSPDGKYLAYKSSDVSGVNLLSIRNLETGELRSFPTAFRFFSEPRWSPDASWLVAGARDFKGGRAIYRFDAMTGAASELAPGRQNSRVEVSPDGRKIYYDYHPEYRGAYVEVDVETGATREVFQKPAGVEDGRKELSPDGRYVATVTLARDNKEQKAGGDSYGDESSVLLIPVAGGEPRKLQSVSRPERFWPYGGLTWAPDSRAVVVLKAIGEGDWESRKKELWLVPVGDGEARKLDIDVSDWHLSGGGIRLHPNGKQIAFFAGKRSQEVWALEDFLPTLDTSK